jgi:hypothetical protein
MLKNRDLAMPGTLAGLRRAESAILEALGFGLFFLMLFVPSAFQPVKGVLLLLVLAALTARIALEHRVALHPRVAVASLFFSLVGLLFVLRGYLAGAPGALRMAQVFVLWPCVYTVLLTGLARESRLWRVGNLLVWSTTAICLYSLIFVLWSVGFWPDALYFSIRDQRLGFHDGTVELSARSLMSLMFLVPFVAAALLTWPRTAPVARRSLWLALALGLGPGLLSGRRALQLVLVLSVPLALVLRMLLPPRLRRSDRGVVRRTLIGAIVAAGLAVLTVQWMYPVRLGSVWSVFTTGFQFGSDPVALSRAQQFDALIRGWLTSPLLGSGHGAAAPDMIRSLEMPWAYELTYVALLYHTGLVGALLYAGGILWIYIQAVRIIRGDTALAPLTVAVLTGTTTFLIAAATNPYLERYDALWVIFLPLAIINASWLAERTERADFNGRQADAI